MEKKDLSREIYEKFFHTKEAVRVELRDGRILKGFFVGMYHGEPDWNEPYVIRWRFIPADEMKSDFVPGTSRSVGIMIRQKDIKEVGPGE